MLIPVGVESRAHPWVVVSRRVVLGGMADSLIFVLNFSSSLHRYYLCGRLSWSIARVGISLIDKGTIEEQSCARRLNWQSSVRISLRM